MNYECCAGSSIPHSRLADSQWHHYVVRVYHTLPKTFTIQAYCSQESPPPFKMAWVRAVPEKVSGSWLAAYMGEGSGGYVFLFDEVGRVVVLSSPSAIG